MIKNTRIKLEKYLEKKNKSIYKNENSKKIKIKTTGNSRILITGATSGIGYEIAKMINHYKPKLIISGRKEEKVKKSNR